MLMLARGSAADDLVACTDALSVFVDEDDDDVVLSGEAEDDGDGASCDFSLADRVEVEVEAVIDDDVEDDDDDEVWPSNRALPPRKTMSRAMILSSCSSNSMAAALVLSYATFVSLSTLRAWRHLKSCSKYVALAAASDPSATSCATLRYVSTELLNPMPFNVHSGVASTDFSIACKKETHALDSQSLRTWVSVGKYPEYGSNWYLVTMTHASNAARCAP